MNSWAANRLDALFYHRSFKAYVTDDHLAWDEADFEDWVGRTMAAVQAGLATLNATA